VTEGQQTDPPRGDHEAPRVILRDPLGNPVPFCAAGETYGEEAQLGIARGERDTGEHGGDKGETEALAVPFPIEGRDGLLDAIDGRVPLACG
jgi:hypothetical protein